MQLIFLINGEYNFTYINKFKDGNVVQARMIWALIDPNFRKLHSKLKRFF